MRNHKKKHILITAGPVWVPIDRVRVITNIFGGRLGFYIAKEALKRGFAVTILLGPTRISYDTLNSRAKIIRFHYYEEIKKKLFRLLRSGKYSALIHSAAVSDYQPYPVVNGKIKSGSRKINIKLKPTIKLVDYVKKISPNIILVKFKLEVDKTKKELVKIARKSLITSSADVIVANEFSTINNKHEAFIINSEGDCFSTIGKHNIANEIMNIVDEKLSRS